MLFLGILIEFEADAIIFVVHVINDQSNHIEHNLMNIKQLTFSITFLFFSMLLLASEHEGPKSESDGIYFPKVHFAPATNRMGTPISIVQKDGKQFLYYQYNPNNFENAYYNWGSATSEDGIHWNTENIVISQKEGIADKNENSPVWGTAANIDGSIQAIYNRWNEGLFSYKLTNNSSEELLSQKTELLNAEPFIFKYKPKDVWVMVSFNRADSILQIFNSDDLHNWTLKSAFQYEFGFPALYELSVKHQPELKKWVLITEGATYQVGDFDGEKFTSDGSILKFDYGRNLGGSVCLPNANHESLVVYTEMKHQDNQLLTSSGMLSFPSTLTLNEDDGKFILYKQPVEAINQLFLKGTEWVDRKIYPGIKNNLLARTKGDCFYMDGTIDIATCNIWGLGIRGTRTEIANELSYVVQKGIFSAMGTGINYIPEDKKIEFKIIIDRSSIEIYLDEGKYCISSTFFPDPEAKFYELLTRGGEIIVDQMRVYPLKSIWNQE